MICGSILALVGAGSPRPELDSVCLRLSSCCPGRESDQRWHTSQRQWHRRYGAYLFLFIDFPDEFRNYGNFTVSLNRACFMSLLIIQYNYNAYMNV